MRAEEFWDVLRTLGTEFESLHGQVQSLSQLRGLVTDSLVFQVRARNAVVKATAPRTPLRGVAHWEDTIETPRRSTPITPRRWSSAIALQPAVHDVAHCEDTMETQDRSCVNLDESETLFQRKGEQFLFHQTLPDVSSSACISKAGVTTQSSVDRGTVLWPVWLEDAKDDHPTSGASLAMAGLKTRNPSRKKIRLSRLGDVVQEEGFWQSLILRPTSPVAIFWVVMLILVLAYDVISVPLLVFHESDSVIMDCLNGGSTIFWTLDIFVSFLMGFEVGGMVEMRPTKIAKRYLASWFAFDIIIVVPDWLALLSKNAGFGGPLAALRIIKTLKLLRALRVTRFFRFFQFQHVSWVVVHMHDEVCGIIKFIIVILVIVHYIACGWYTIGTHGIDPSMTRWVDKFELDNDPDNLTTKYMYFTCLHWSLSQFTPAGMEVYPRTTVERIYAIVVILIGLVVFSSFVSGITAASTTLRKSTMERTRQNAHVRRYILSKRISIDLSNRIANVLKEQGKAKHTRVVESDVIAFQRLPEQLLFELHGEVHLPVLVAHPVFHQLEMIDATGLSWICHTAASEVSMAEKKLLFSTGEGAAFMSFVTHGTLSYFFSELQSNHNVQKGDYLCEASLWLRWKHAGQLEVLTVCEMIHVNASSFRCAACQTIAMESLRLYAQEFAKRFGTSSCSDMWGVGFDDQQEMAQIAFEKQFQDLSHSLATVTSRGGFKEFFGSLSDTLQRMGSILSTIKQERLNHNHQ